MNLEEAKNRIIVPIDTMDLDVVRDLVHKLTGQVWGFKLGLELCSAHGALRVVRIVRSISGDAAKIFLDHKLHDIPNTVAGAARANKVLAVNLFTVHASGGVPMMREAVENCGEAQVLAVTVLTSLTEAECVQIYGKPPQQAVIEFASMAQQAGVPGIVCSPRELEVLGQGRHAEQFAGLIRVVAGIRPTWAAPNDQKRIMTPLEARRLGAHYLVIGRPITDYPPESGGPIHAVNLISEEISRATQGV